MSKTTLKPVPDFASEAEEQAFWQTHDSTDYVDWSTAERVRLPNLKLSTTTISLRMPLGMLDQIKVTANKRDMPYQSLIKAWLAERVEGLTISFRHAAKAPAPAKKPAKAVAKRAPAKRAWAAPAAKALPAKAPAAKLAKSIATAKPGKSVAAKKPAKAVAGGPAATAARRKSR